MKINQNLTLTFITFFSILFFGCSEEPRTYKYHDILGYWKAEEKLYSYKNGEQNPIFSENYYIEFRKDNCGYVYDENEDWVNDIKWALQERPQADRLLLSYALKSNGMSTNLHLNTLSIIGDFTADSFHIYRFESDSIGEDLFTRHYNTWLERVD